MTLLYVCQLGIMAILAVMVYGLTTVVRELRQQNAHLSKIESFQMNPRTRMKQAAMDSGPPSLEKDLVRLGRSTQGRRVVVGGEEDSQLNRDLGVNNV